MIQVATSVEFNLFAEFDISIKIPFFPCVWHFIQRLIQIIDVGFMVFIVVKVHLVRTHDRLKIGELVKQLSLFGEAWHLFPAHKLSLQRELK